MTVRDDLKRWGAALTARHDRPAGQVHALTRARDFAPGTRENAAKRLIGRDGIGRRTLMGKAAGRVVTAPDGRIVRVFPVPFWSCDPVPSRNDAGAGFDPPLTPESACWVDPMPDDLRWVGQVVAALSRTHRMRALVLQAEFTTHGPQRERAERLSAEYGGTFTLDMYRKELRKALEFVEVWRALDNAA